MLAQRVIQTRKRKQRMRTEIGKRSTERVEGKGVGWGAGKRQHILGEGPCSLLFPFRWL